MANAAGLFGSPEPTAQAGKLSIGVGYLNYLDKWEPDDRSFLIFPIFWDEMEVRQNQIYVQASYGFVKNWEFYLRLGGADVKVEDAFFGLQDFEDDFKFSGTVGIKGLFYKKDNYFGIGPFLQATALLQDYEDEISGYVIVNNSIFPATFKLEYQNALMVDGGVAFFLKYNDVSLYGGPFYSWGETEVEGKVSAMGISVSDSTDYEEKNNFGGFLGLRVYLGEGFNLEVEGQLKNKFSFGAALTYSF
jgi:hypothetical protein